MRAGQASVWRKVGSARTPAPAGRTLARARAVGAGSHVELHARAQDDDGRAFHGLRHGGRRSVRLCVSPSKNSAPGVAVIAAHGASAP